MLGGVRGPHTENRSICSVLLFGALESGKFRKPIQQAASLTMSEKLHPLTLAGAGLDLADTERQGTSEASNNVGLVLHVSPSLRSECTASTSTASVASQPESERASGNAVKPPPSDRDDLVAVVQSLCLRVHPWPAFTGV